MEYIQIRPTELAHLARLALAGRSQDVQLCIRRLARRLRTSHPQAAEQLYGLLQQLPTTRSPLRGVNADPLPVDTDSRLQLLRSEYPVQLDVSPIWAESVRKGLEQIVSERMRRRELLAADLQPTRTVLFTGPPGVGKSLAAKWIASKLDLPLLVLDLSAVISSFLGRTGANVRHVLDYARGVECILLLDELDAIAKRRDDATDVGELKRLVTVLLQEVDDWPGTGTLIAATNHPGLLDPAVWRRFEMLVEFPMPTPEQVHQAVLAFLGSAPPEARALDKALSVVLRGLSFNDIEREILRVRRAAIVQDEPIGQGLDALIGRRIAGLDRRARKDVAMELNALGYSQREASALTGVSRDTIRRGANTA